jgi:hypothetical protein
MSIADHELYGRDFATSDDERERASSDPPPGGARRDFRGGRGGRGGRGARRRHANGRHDARVSGRGRGRGSDGANGWISSSGEDDDDDDDDDGHPQQPQPQRQQPPPPPYAGGMGYFGPIEDDEDGAAAPRDHANDALLDGQPCRAPQDDEDFEEGDGLVNDFPSIFIVDDGQQDGGMDEGFDLGREDLQHSWARLNQLINENLAAGMAVKSIVDLVSQYYERCVRSTFADAPLWSKSSIAKYILRNSPQARDRQADVVIDSVYATINLLRNNVALRNKETGEIRPNDNTIKTLLGAAKVHAALVDARAKRIKMTAA